MIIILEIFNHHLMDSLHIIKYYNILILEIMLQTIYDKVIGLLITLLIDNYKQAMK